MRYKRFIISNYRAISGPLEIRVDKGTLTPIIGVNESGKTTILQAIYSFDLFNDDSNDGGRHLKDTTDLYRSSSPAATVEAEIEMSLHELKKAFRECIQDAPKLKEAFEELIRRKRLPTKISIVRDISTLQYAIPSTYFGDNELQNILARKMLRHLPYILYFDDFRDKIAEKIEIPDKGKESADEWFDILQRLFEKTDKTFSIHELPKMEVRQRKSVLSKVQRQLNGTLTREWQTFRLDDRDALKIHIEFESITEALPVQPATALQPGRVLTSQSPQSIVKNYLKLEVVETDQKDNEHFFFISDRSKGFYWFFNFVMKLEFNPKVTTDTDHSIYLLDEPGSYLHAYAQRKLCNKLKSISKTNYVIYCTHSHYLLDPDIIPVTSINVADKDSNGTISLTRLIDYRGSTIEPRSALQPVLDALQIKPYALDLVNSQLTVLVEGIYDYYSLELFRAKRELAFVPCLGADSIKTYIPLMIAWKVEFRALWDNDPEGRKMYSLAESAFGDEIAMRSLRLLPAHDPDGRWIMQNMFEGSDLVYVRETLGLSNGASFERTILALFYSPNREHLVSAMTETTKQRFGDLFKSLGA